VPINLNENMKRVLLYIRNNYPVSRVDIAEKLDITKPTSSRIIEKLINENLIIEEGYGESTGGRRPTLLTFNPNCFYSFGVSIGRKEIKVALVNLNGEFKEFKEMPITGKEEEDMIFTFIQESFFEMMIDVNVDISRILGVGVGIPGPVKIENKMVTTPTFFSGKPTPIIEKINGFIDVPIIIEKDANAAALAEKWFGLGKEMDNFVYVMADVGVGCGLIIQKQLYRGADGEAGGLGHTTINIFGEQCSCGNFGCLETIVSVPKIEENLRGKLKLTWNEESRFLELKSPDDVNFKTITKALNNGSTMVRTELHNVGMYLGVGIANVVSFFNPEVVILGGAIGSVDIVKDSVKESLFSRVIGSKGKVVPVHSSKFEEGVVLGAAALIIEDTFSIFS